MPVIKCSNGKYRIGSGACIFETEEAAQRVWAAIRVSMVDSYNDYPDRQKFAVGVPHYTIDGVLLKNGRPENSKYTTDFDLLPKGHPKNE